MIQDEDPSSVGLRQPGIRVQFRPCERRHRGRRQAIVMVEDVHLCQSSVPTSDRTSDSAVIARGRGSRASERRRRSTAYTESLSSGRVRDKGLAGAAASREGASGVSTRQRRYRGELGVIPRSSPVRFCRVVIRSRLSTSRMCLAGSSSSLRPVPDLGLVQLAEATQGCDCTEQSMNREQNAALRRDPGVAFRCQRTRGRDVFGRRRV